jgi:hypothetical protein
MVDKIKDLDYLEDAMQNAIASAAIIGTFSLAPISVTDLTQINADGREAMDDNLTKIEEKSDYKE